MNEVTECQVIIEALRRGTPPNEGVNRYSVGNERLLKGVERYLFSAIEGQGIIRFVSGSWGSGKTHFFRQLRELACDHSILVSTVELSNDSAALNKFERIFQAIVESIRTPAMIRQGHNPDAAPFGLVLEEALLNMASRQDPSTEGITSEVVTSATEKLMTTRGIDIDFRKAVQQYWETHVSGNQGRAVVHATRGELLQWFSAQGTASSYRKRFGITKMIGRQNARLMLQSLAQFVQLAGYRGLLVLFDEAELGYSLMRKSQLRDAHNNLLSLINSIGSQPGLFLLYATTRDFYSDPKHGIVIYGALASRIGQPDDKPPRALDTIWNLDGTESGLPQYTQASERIRTIYCIAYPEAEDKVMSTSELEQFVRELHESHPRLGGMNFWRVLVSSVVAKLDDGLEGDVRSTAKIREDVMRKLREG